MFSGLKNELRWLRDALSNPWNLLIVLCIILILLIMVLGLLFSAGNLNQFDMGRHLSLRLPSCHAPTNEIMLWIIYSGMLFVISAIFAIGELVGFVEGRRHVHRDEKTLIRQARHAGLWGSAAVVFGVTAFYFVSRVC